MYRKVERFKMTWNHRLNSGWLVSSSKEGMSGSSRDFSCTYKRGDGNHCYNCTADSSMAGLSDILFVLPGMRQEKTPWSSLPMRETYV